MSTERSATCRTCTAPLPNSATKLLTVYTGLCPDCRRELRGFLALHPEQKETARAAAGHGAVRAERHRAATRNAARAERARDPEKARDRLRRWRAAQRGEA